MAYTAFVTDVYTRQTRGWNVASSLKTELLPLPAFDHATWAASTDLSGLIHHSNHEPNDLSLAYTTRLTEPGITPSIGTVGDNYDNALAETVNNAYKAELIRRRRPWKNVKEVELATLEWVYRYNNERLHEAFGYITPAEHEAAHQAASPTHENATSTVVNT